MAIGGGGAAHAVWPSAAPARAPSAGAVGVPGVGPPGGQSLSLACAPEYSEYPFEYAEFSL
jgi:hypothetical protein